MLGQHGLINWADDDKACYDLTLDLIERAARTSRRATRATQTFGGQTAPGAGRGAAPRDVRRDPALAARPGQPAEALRRHHPGRRDHSALCEQPRRRRGSPSWAPRCPDHFLRTKIKPLYVAWNPQAGDVDALKRKLSAGLEQYRQDYAAYYEQCKHADSPAMRDPNPTVILIPGLGMIAWGKDKSESRVTAEFYNCAVEVMRGAEAIDEYIALPQRSPSPFSVPWIWRAPARTAASELATPLSVSLCTWMPRWSPGMILNHLVTIFSISSGSVPPLVSHSTTQRAPASYAVLAQASA